MNKAIRTVVKFLVNSNLFIAFCTLAATFQTYLLLDITLNSGPLPVLLFFASLLVYNIHRLIALPEDPEKDASAMHTWMRDNSIIMIGLIGFSLFAIGMSFLMLNNQSRLILTLLGLISVLYVLPVKLPGFPKLRLRDIGILKPFIVGGVWAVATVILPILHTGLEICEPDNIALALQCFFFISALCIPFDVRDLDYDRATLSFPTIAMAFGLKATKLIGSLVLALFLAVVIYRGLSADYHRTLWIAHLITFIISWSLLLLTTPTRSEYYYTFRIDSVIILQFILIACSNYISL